MAKPQEKELSALELMIEHADSVATGVVGAPKAKRARKPANESPFSEYEESLLETDTENTYYVGPGSRRLNREAKARREAKRDSQPIGRPTAPRDDNRQLEVNVNHSIAKPSIRQIEQPNAQHVEVALENLFEASEKSGGDIVKAIKDGTQVNKNTLEAIEDWLTWEKAEAFKEKNRAKSDPHGKQPGNNFVSDAVPANDESSGGDFFDAPERRSKGEGRGKKRGRRYGRSRGEKRGAGAGRSRNLPKTSRLRGKTGLVLGLVTAGAALLGGNWLKERSQSEYEDENAKAAGAGAPDYVDDSDSPEPISPAEMQQATTAGDAAAIRAVDSDVPKAPTPAEDAAAMGASTLLMGATRRLPIVGPALGNGIMAVNEAQHIRADDTLTDAEKNREYKKTAGRAIGGTAGGTAGAVAGGWIGGILGSVVPVAGTAAGAALGATIGGILGDYFGSSVGEYVSEKITDESDAMLADGEKDRQEKIEEYNKTTLENQDKAKFPAPTGMPFGLGLGALAFGGGFGGGGGGGGGGEQYQGPFRAQSASRYDSKQITDIANKAISEGGLGSVSEQFESGGKGVGTVSTGAGDAGGVSYGKHQLATNNGSMMNFLNSKEGQPFLQRFGGLAPGTAQFNSVYKDVANTQGAEFDKAQSDYITRTHYAPLVAKVQNDLGLDLSTRGAGVKELLYSTGVQYGAGTSVINNALQGKDINAMSDPELIKTIQDYKSATTDRYFKSSSAQTRQAVALRAQNEKDVLLKVDEAERKKAVNKQPETMSEQDKRIAEKFPDLPKGSGQYSADADATVDANKAIPDFTGRGTVVPKYSPEDRERRLEELVGRRESIAPVPQPIPPVDRQPLVTEGDVAQRQVPETPAAAPVQEAPRTQGAGVPQQKGSSSPSPSNGHSLDAIPIFLNDPMLNAVTMGYM